MCMIFHLAGRFSWVNKNGLIDALKASSHPKATSDTGCNTLYS
jgi:hypothetical protein